MVRKEKRAKLAQKLIPSATKNFCFIALKINHFLVYLNRLNRIDISIFSNETKISIPHQFSNFPINISPHVSSNSNLGDGIHFQGSGKLFSFIDSFISWLGLLYHSKERAGDSCPSVTGFRAICKRWRKKERIASWTHKSVSLSTSLLHFLPQQTLQTSFFIQITCCVRSCK